MKFQSVENVLNQISSDQILDNFVDFEDLWKIFSESYIIVLSMWKVTQDQGETITWNFFWESDTQSDRTDNDDCDLDFQIRKNNSLYSLNFEVLQQNHQLRVVKVIQNWK